MLYGKCFTAAFGPTDPEILSIKGSSFGGGIRAAILVRPQYRERYFAIFVNAAFIGTVWCDISGLIETIVPRGVGSSIGSFYLEDVGMNSGFAPTDIQYISMHARRQDALTANRIYMAWSNTTSYKLTTVKGDTQLSSITITGALRGVNVENIQDMTARGRLYYSLVSVAGTYILRWWNGNKLVAEGSRVGNGSVTCAAFEDSGLSVTATIAYTTEVKKGAAFLDVKWPFKYQIHYSTSTLTYPRTPEDTVYDNGSSDYSYITAALVAGTYNFNVVSVDDEGDIQAAPSAPTDSPLLINGAPAAPTITAVSGTAAAGLTITFSNGVAGCTYKLYYSVPNGPINEGLLASPTPIGPSAVNATSLTTAAITGYASVDNSGDYTNVQAAIDSAVSTCNTAFSAVSGMTPPATNEAAFLTAFNTMVAGIKLAVTTYGTALNLSFRETQEQIDTNAVIVSLYLTTIMGTLTGDDWKTQAGQYYGGFLSYLGTLLEDQPTRYSLANGAVAGSQNGSSSLGTTARGELAEMPSKTNTSLYKIGQPFVKPGIVRLIVRATKTSIEELNGSVYEVELDNSGNIVTARPPKADIVDIAISGLTITMTGGLIEDGALASATILDFYVIAAASTINTASPSVSGTLPSSGVNSYREISAQFTVGASGWYQIAILARTAAGVRSLLYDIRYVEISNDTPNAAGSIKGYVVRSKGR